MYTSWFSPGMHFFPHGTIFTELELFGWNKSIFCVRNGVREEGQSREGKRRAGLRSSTALTTAEAGRRVWDSKSRAATHKGVGDPAQAPSKPPHQSELQVHSRLFHGRYETEAPTYAKQHTPIHTHTSRGNVLRKNINLFLPHRSMICNT